MKKLLLLLPIYLICQSTYAQIVILEIPKSTEIGKMSGYYKIQKLVDKTEFNVSIPEFVMVLPAKLN